MSTQVAGKQATYLTVAAIVALCLPPLVLGYLPMTDVPQHLAVSSILQHHGDPTYGFAEHYNIDWWRAPYVLPYVLVTVVGQVLDLKTAMHSVVFLSVLAYPLSIALLLRAADKPVWFALLALPFVYNRAFFWGFINFNLSIGLAIAAFSFYVSRKRSLGRDLAQALLALGATFTHIYGLAMMLGLVFAYAICGGFAAIRARRWSLLPLGAGIVLWALSAGEQAGFGVPLDPPIKHRLIELPSELLGGYQDRSEVTILAIFVVAWTLLAWRNLPIRWARIRTLTPLERVGFLVLVGNLFLYFILPQATWTAKFVHFRHAFLAVTLLPVLASSAAAERRSLVRALPVVLAVATVLNSWGHLVLFNQEARRFDAVLAAVPTRARIVSLTFEPNGDIMATFPYLHFAAYAQAERGGIISMTFPAFFWNLPVELRSEAPIPETPEGLEWNPSLYSEKAFGYYYDHALVRIPGKRSLAASPNFPFELVVALPPWQLYRRVDP